jgi:NSS family neurotransmitter:Na+ symporter
MSNNTNSFSKLGFILAAAGSAIGLGNIWRLPALVAQYGGGTFLLQYFIICFTIALAVLIAELALGRYLGDNYLYKAKDKLKQSNKSTLLSIFFPLGGIPLMLILTFYFVVCGWILIYIYQTITGGISYNPAITNAEYYGNFFGGLISNTISVVFATVLFILLTAYINYKGLINGIEKANFIMLPALFIILTAMIIRSLTLDGALEGVKYIFSVDLSAISKESFIAALKQSFFSLSLGFGVMVTFSASSRKEMNLKQSAFYTVLLGAGIGLFTSLLIIPAAVSFGYSLNAGPSLTFITLPNVFAQLPFGILFAFLFFLVMAMAALTSTISLYEVGLNSVKYWFNINRNTANFILLVFFIIVASIQANSFTNLSGITIAGKGIFDFSADLADILLVVFGGLSCIFAGYIFNKNEIKNEITNNGKLSFKLYYVWLAFIKVISPLFILYLLYIVVKSF